MKHFYNTSQQNQPNKAVVILQDSWLSVIPENLNDCNLLPDCFQNFPSPGIGPFSSNHPHYLIGDNLYLTTPGSGQIYQAGPDSIFRIDRSFDHRVQQGAVEFIRNDTIWRHGGYGGWSARNIITFFDPAAREWEVYRPLNGPVIPPALWNHRAFIDGDSLWLFGGYVFQENNPGAGKPNTDVWLFEFGTRSWKNLGPLNSTLLGVIDRPKNCLVANGKGKALLFHNGVIIALDLRANSSTELTVKGKTTHFMHGMCPWTTRDMIYQLDYASAHSGYSPSDSGQVAILFSDSLKRLLSNGIGVTHQIVLPQKPAPARFLLWLAPPTLLISVFLFMMKRRRKVETVQVKNEKLVLTTEGLICGQALHRLEPLQLAIIRLLLDSENEVTTDDIMGLVQNPNLDYTHNLRIKGQVIENINVHLKSILKISSDPIRITPSRIDRRVRAYTIEKNLFA